MLPPFVELDEEGLDVQVWSKYVTLWVGCCFVGNAF